MKIRGLERLKRWSKKLWLKTQPRALILAYHRVTELNSDPQLLGVSPENFAEHLQIIRQFYHPLSLKQLTQHLKQGKIPHQSVILTFDDGYADNFHQAKPLLEHYNIPATVFVTAGHVEQNYEFWWDDLERILLLPHQLPEKLSLTINKQTYHWQLGNSTDYSQQEYLRDSYWNVLSHKIPTPRHDIYSSVCSLLRPLPTEERQHFLREISAWANQNPEGRITHQALTKEEIKQLTAKGLIEVGAHSMTHPVLSTLDKAQQQAEIQQSKAYLEKLLEQPVTSFAYPYGSKSDYNKDTIATVEESGFDCTCANFPDLVWRGSNLFQLPRFLVRNWSKEKFAQILKEWFNGRI